MVQHQKYTIIYPDKMTLCLCHARIMCQYQLGFTILVSCVRSILRFKSENRSFWRIVGILSSLRAVKSFLRGAKLTSFSSFQEFYSTSIYCCQIQQKTQTVSHSSLFVLFFQLFYLQNLFLPRDLHSISVALLEKRTSVNISFQ